MSIFTQIANRFIVPATHRISGLHLVFDIEANGLLDVATKLHCVVVADLDSECLKEYGPGQIDAALRHLGRANYLTGHNICSYDLALLKKLHNWSPSRGCVVVDTLIASRLILPNIPEIDDRVAAQSKKSLGKLRGRYSIEAWGERLGMPKTGKDIEDWSEWTQEMQNRCVSDVKLCKLIWHTLQPDGCDQDALNIEHEVSSVCDRITSDGIPFDTKAANKLNKQWVTRQAELEKQLAKEFPGVNMNSRMQLGKLLEGMGWKFTKRTEKTNRPKVDDEVLESAAKVHPELQGLAEHSIIGRRLGQLENGDQAWLKNVDANGYIHGSVVHIGTPHSRAAHFNPNIAQVPNNKRGKPFAVECRALFHHPGDWVFVSCDQAGLQDRCFSHYLAEFDGGAYGRSFVAGADTHWASAIALGLVAEGTERDKTSKLHGILREGSKSFRYGFLFGMRARRAAEIITSILRAAIAINPEYSGPKVDGGQALKRFEAATPGLKELRRSLEAEAAKKQWVPGLDNRRVPTGAQYKALNRIVTSAEAVICKRWLVQVHKKLCDRFNYGWNGDVVITAWIHDELVCCCQPQIAAAVGDIMVELAKEAGKHYGMRLPLDASYTVGRNWAGEPVNEKATKAPRKAADGAAGVSGKVAAITPETTPVRLPVTENIVSFPGIKRPLPAPITAILGNPVTPSNGSDNSGHKVLCPFHEDHDPSLHIYTDGHFHCFVCGKHGSIDELPNEVLNGATARLEKPSGSDTDNLQNGLRLWKHTKPIKGTLGEQYLTQTRELDLGAVTNIHKSLRFDPSCPFDGKRHPCVVALFSDLVTDEPAGIHRIGLTNKAEKIDRKMLGSWPQARAIKLRHDGDELLIGEGIETTIGGIMKLSWRGAAWALGSATAIGNFPVLPGIRRLIILVDNDANNIGRVNALRCVTRWNSVKVKVGMFTSQAEKSDFNDLIKGKKK